MRPHYDRRDPHNIPDEHKDRMAMRRELQKNRKSGFTPVYTKTQIKAYNDQQVKLLEESVNDAQSEGS
jgi:hypothetical protein